MKRGIGRGEHQYNPSIVDDAGEKCHRTGECPVIIPQPAPQPAPVAPQIPVHALQSPQAAGQALFDAVQNRNGHDLVFLLQDALRRHIPYGYKGWALVESVKTGDLVMTSFIASYVVSEVHPKQVQLAKDTATELGRQDMVDEITRVQNSPRI